MPLRTYNFDLPERLHERAGHVISVAAIIGPAETGPFPTDEAVQNAVERAITFNKRLLAVYCLGDNLPPIVASQGKRPTFVASESRTVEDDDSLTFSVDHYSFSDLGGALVYAIALRDRRNLNDARQTATAIQRLLTAVD